MGFYLDLIRPPDEQWYTDAAFFLMSPPAGPFSNLADIESLSPSALRSWIDKVKEQYQRQQEEIDKIKSKKR